jgi:threonine dehydratase
VTAPLVTVDDIRAAATRIRPHARRTPLLDVPPGGAHSLFLKCENLQAAGAFKVRGACNMLAQLSRSAREAGVITFSSGNHAQAVALAAARFDTRAVVVMPETAPRVKVDGARRLGAEVMFAGTTLLDRKARAEAEAGERGLTMVPPFDHPWIIAGAGTVGLEILEDCPQATAVYVPVGGGGLVAGVAAAIKGMRSTVRVIGVEPAGAPKMSLSLAAGRPVTLDSTASIADGLLALRPGDLPFAHVQALVDDIVQVTDDEIAAAVKWLFREARLVAEPSGAAAVAAAIDAARRGTRGGVAVISGGNVDGADFARYVG